MYKPHVLVLAPTFARLRYVLPKVGARLGPECKISGGTVTHPDRFRGSSYDLVVVIDRPDMPQAALGQLEREVLHPALCGRGGDIIYVSTRD